MRKGEQTRQEIIRKAAPIFNQKGYDGAALSDLMRATGLEKGGIYRHFGSKQELAGEASTTPGNSQWIAVSKARSRFRIGWTASNKLSTFETAAPERFPEAPAAERGHRFRP